MLHPVQPPSPPTHDISRRRLLRLGLLAAVVPCVSRPVLALEHPAQQRERSLDFYNVHTGESLTTVYWIKGTYVPGALRDINYILRDHYADQVKPIDPQLRDAFHIVSAYRSPATNAMLRFSHVGVAEHSMHVEGKGVDVRFFGRDLVLVHRLATALQWGGIGYYPWASFVHLDTGPVRVW